MTILSLFKSYQDGSQPISRFFRRIFEYKRIKLALGINLAALIILMSGLSPSTNAFNQEEAVLSVLKNNVIHTEISLKQPVSGNISQTYHWYHQAIDITADLKTPVKAIASGKVIEVGYDRWGYGNKVVIEHENNTQSLYAHLDEIRVKQGDEINQDSTIGTLGLTGWTTGPHLHLEIAYELKKINPQEVLPDFTYLLAKR